MKWTRKKDKVHRRYFWLDVGRSMMYWAKAPGTTIYLSSALKIEEIAEIQSQCVVDDVTGKTFYLLIIWSLTRVTQIGTEQRDKFDMWFDTLQKLTESVQQYNAKFFGRYSTMPVKQPTQQRAVYSGVSGD